MKKDMRLEQKIFDDFCKNIREKNRFFANNEILNIFDALIDEFSIIIPTGTKLFRGRLNPHNNCMPYEGKDIGRPEVQYVKHPGRLNPSGISYLYMANTIETVVNELRPELNSCVSIGKFEVVKDMKVLKFSNQASSGHNKKLRPDFSLALFGIILSSEFSRNIDYQKSEYEYIPTQYFAAYCESKGIEVLCI